MNMEIVVSTAKYCYVVSGSTVQSRTFQFRAVRTVQFITGLCSTVQCKTVHVSTVQCITVQCAPMECSPVQPRIVQYSAVSCRTLQCTMGKKLTVLEWTVKPTHREDSNQSETQTLGHCEELSAMYIILKLILLLPI